MRLPRPHSVRPSLQVPLTACAPHCLPLQVRPPLRGLLKVLAASHPGNALLNIQRHLVSGHWVLSFPDADRAASAAQHVEEWAHKMRAVYCQLLHPLLEAGGGGGEGEGDAAGAPSALNLHPWQLSSDAAAGRLWLGRMAF